MNNKEKIKNELNSKYNNILNLESRRGIEGLYLSSHELALIKDYYYFLDKNNIKPNHDLSFVLNFFNFDDIRNIILEDYKFILKSFDETNIKEIYKLEIVKKDNIKIYINGDKNPFSPKLIRNKIPIIYEKLYEIARNSFCDYHDGTYKSFTCRKDSPLLKIINKPFVKKIGNKIVKEDFIEFYIRTEENMNRSFGQRK